MTCMQRFFVFSGDNFHVYTLWGVESSDETVETFKGLFVANFKLIKIYYSPFKG